MSARHHVSRTATPGRRGFGLPVMVAAVVAVLVATLLAGCGTFVTASTGRAGDPANGTSTNSGLLDVRNVVAVSGQNGVATLTATIINNGTAADSLTAVSSPSGAAALKPTAISLPARAVTSIGAPAATGSSTATSPAITLTGKSIHAGGTVRVTLQFADSPQVTLTALVMPNSGEFTAVPVPTATPAVAAG